MPRLKQLSCCVQWADTKAPFQELGTVYGDGVVESFIVVPNKPQRFCIQLTSQGFIYEGLAVVVFIDGDYHVNRSRVNLLPPQKGLATDRTEVDFLLRQKEKAHGDGVYMGREWRFDNHNIVPEAPLGFHESHFDDLGTIEVLVLRCKAAKQADAEYEGSSSGEDSDIFGERPVRDKVKENVEAPAKVNLPVTAPVAAKSESPPPPPAEDEGEMLGGFGLGLFDGANDYHEPSNRDGGYDGEGGRWIWHQKESPPGLHLNRSQYHQTAEPRFRTSSYQHPAYHLRREAQHNRTTAAAPPPKQVHFEYGPGGPSQRRSSYVQPQDQSSPWQDQVPPRPINPERPMSRERMRSADPRSANEPESRRPSGPPYGSQQLPVGQDVSSWNAQPSSGVRNETSRYGDDEKPLWGNENGSLHRPSTMYYDEPRPQNETSDRIRTGHPEFRQPSYDETGQNHPHNALPHPSQPTLSQPQVHYGHSGHMIPNTYHPPTQYYPYPMPIPALQPQPQIAGHPPAYWPPYYPWSYGPHYGSVPGGRQGSGEHYPPLNVHPSMEDQVSPLTTTFPTTGADGDANAQTNHASDSCIAQQGNGNGGNHGWGDEAGNKGSEGAVNGDNNGVQNDTDCPWDNGNNGNQDSGNTGEGGDQWPEKTNDDGGVDNNNDNNGGWNGNNNAGDTNNGAHEIGWPSNDDTGKNDSAAAAGDVWGAEPKATAPRSKEPAAIANVLDMPRELYGPHGAYYSFRALRLDEPRPDAEEEPRFDVPKSLATQRGSSKQVQPGPGYRYFKKRTAPQYIDSLESPYARFVFKYRTRDQLRDETGIEVEVEPTGDREIQDLQNLDKQALIEMLMRAKGALGGKVPSPPLTPSTSAGNSDSGAPVAIQAPSYPYLKYSLPPLRPMPNSSRRPASESSPAVNNNNFNKENENFGWDAQPNSNNNNSTWDVPANKTTNDQWAVGGGNGWDGPSAKQASGQNQASRRGSQVNNTSPQPPSQDGWAQPADTPLQQDMSDNWDKGDEGNAGGDGWGTGDSGAQVNTTW